MSVTRATQFNLSDYMEDLNGMRYYKPTLHDTPFQLRIMYDTPTLEANVPNRFCDHPMFHFDSYQAHIPRHIRIKMTNDSVDIASGGAVLYVFPNRIGRWIFDGKLTTQRKEGIWIEPDCKWKRFDLIEVESTTFFGSKMHMKFVGASNFELVRERYKDALCPEEKNLFQNGEKCKNKANLKNNQITFEWQFFRGSCIYRERNGYKRPDCADPYAENIVKKNMMKRSMRHLFGLLGQTTKHPIANITLLSNGLWNQRYSKIEHVVRLYEGFEYMMEECHEKYKGQMDILAMFYNQVFATHPAVFNGERSRFINHQLENYIELALSIINRKEQYIVGVIWNFERTLSRHY
eukprot:712352_1